MWAIIDHAMFTWFEPSLFSPQNCTEVAFRKKEIDLLSRSVRFLR